MSQYRVQQWATFARSWWIYDAYKQCPFKSAEKLAMYLEGRNKPIYHPLSDVGDHVVVVNTKYIAMEGDSWRTHLYRFNTGYAKGRSTKRAWMLHEADETAILKKAVYGALPTHVLRRTMMNRLHLYPQLDVPSEILNNVTDQIRQVMPVHKRLDQYSREELTTFPKLFDWPEDYVIEHGDKKNPDDVY